MLQMRVVAGREHRRKDGAVEVEGWPTRRGGDGAELGTLRTQGRAGNTAGRDRPGPSPRRRPARGAPLPALGGGSAPR